MSDFQDVLDKHYNGNIDSYMNTKIFNAIPSGAKKQALDIVRKAWKQAEPLSAARQKIWRIRERISRIG